jgi:cysteinyl-tRNA synthetase
LAALITAASTATDMNDTKATGTLHVFDTLTGEKRPFEPLEPGRVKMYVCGLTVYDYAHIGHARTFIAFDVIRRYLAHKGYAVTYARNHTDVDDKIIRRANELGEDPGALAARFAQAFDDDMAALNLLPPDLAPRVTQEIPAVLAMVERLISRGHAYVVDGDVYFHVSTFPDYGKLSKRKLEDLRAGERIEVDERKRDPADFALWKSAKPGEPAWDSPWGPGRPGWHIECSAMSTRYLGETFDLHGGGRDLVFPHHENEIAQSEACTGQPFARYWLHAGPLQVEGEKMGKSLGNFWLIRDALALHHPDVLRFFMLTGHYRKPVNYTLEALEEARSRVVYFYKTLRAVERFFPLSPTVPSEGRVREERLLDGFWDEVHAALDDDFNTPRVLAAMGELAKAANDLLPKKLKPIHDPILLRTLDRLHHDLTNAGKVLGLFEQAAEVALTRIRDLRVHEKGLDGADLERLVAARSQARADKDWARADALRDQLLELGVAIMDGAEGTAWEMI